MPIDRIADSARGDFDPELLTNSLSTGADSGYLRYPAIEHIPDNENVEFVFHNKGKYFKMIEQGGNETKLSGDEGWNIVVITGRSIHLLAGGVDGERDETRTIRIKNVDKTEYKTGFTKNKLIIKLNDSHEYAEIRIPVQSSDEVDQASEFINKEPDEREQSQVGIPVWDSKKMYEVSPEEFESIIADLYRDDGYAAQTTQSSNDNGVDVIAKSDEEKVLIQAKKYDPSTTVGIDPVQRTAGLLSDQEWNPTSVVVATTASFSDSAEERAERIEDLQLLDGLSLANKLQKSNIPPGNYGYD